MELKSFESSNGRSSTALPLSSKRSSPAQAASANSNSSNNSPTPDRIDWPRPTILRFIEDYRNLRVLWDANTKGYHMKQTKCEALKALSLKYGTEIRAIRSKIKSLRSSFHREHGKVLSNRRKGISYQPMWFAYEAIRFILDGSESSPRSPSQQNENENENVSGGGEVDVDVDADAEVGCDNDYDNNNMNVVAVDDNEGDGGGGNVVHATHRAKAAVDDDVDDVGEVYGDDEYGEGELNAEEKLALLLNDDKYGSAAAAALTMLTAATTFKDDVVDGLEGGDVAAKTVAEDDTAVTKKIKVETTTTTRTRAANKSTKQASNNSSTNSKVSATQSSKANTISNAQTLTATISATTTSSNTKTTKSNTTTTNTTTPPLSPTSTTTIRAATAHDNYAVGTGTGTGTRTRTRTGTGRESCFPKIDAIVGTEIDETEADRNVENIVARVAASYPATTLGGNSSSSSATAISTENINNLASLANLPSSSMSPRSAAATIFLNAIAAAGFGRHNNNANTAIIKATTTTATPLTTTPLDELTATFRNDLENDAQNYCNISAEDVKTEIIESDSTEAILMSLDQRSNEYRTNFFKNFELQQRESPKFYAPIVPQQQYHQQQHCNRKRKYNNYQQQQYHDDALNLAKIHSNYLTTQARAQDLSTHSSICAMTAIPAGIQLNPKGGITTSQSSTNISGVVIKETLTNAIPKLQAKSLAATTNSSSATPSSASTSLLSSAPSSSSSSLAACTSSSMASSHVDEYGVFGEYVAMTIRKLKTTKAKIAMKHLINNLLYEGELGKYDHGIPASKEPPQLYKT